MTTNGYGISFGGDETFYVNCCDGYITVNVLKMIELYVLSGYIVWCVSENSIKLS